jgi:GNAT superfamily N-acetyltransferase
MSLEIRPALSQDREAIVAISAHIWEGHDYIPRRWEEWLHDPAGPMIVGVLDGLPVGVSKITLQSPEEAWLAGARVHPDYRGQGIATRMLEYTLRWLDERNVSVTRFTTASVNTPVHHMAASFDFERVLSVQHFTCSLEQGNPSQKPRSLPFQLQGTAWKLFRESAFLHATRGLFGIGWTWKRFTQERFRKRFAQGEVLAWGHGLDTLALVIDNPSSHRIRRISMLLGDREDGLALVQALRLVPYLVIEDPDRPPQLRLTVPEGASDLEWVAEQAGMVKHHDFAMWLYERDVRRKL